MWAARYYQAVAHKGYAYGQFRFGQLFLQGKGVRQNPVKACAWMSVARQNFLNNMPKDEAVAANGETALPVDTLQSADVFSTIHLKLINTQLESLQARLSPEQLQEAQQLAGEYMKYR